MLRIHLSRPAAEDVDSVLAWSQTRFGDAGRRRYETLIGSALAAPSEEPTRPTVRTRPDIGPDIRTYHLRHARSRARRMKGIVHRPRHFLVFRIRPADTVEVLRLIHDSMDPKSILRAVE